MTPDAPEPPEGRRVRYEIDRRPLTLVLLSRLRGQIMLAALFGVFAAVTTAVAPPEGLSAAGWKTLCIFALCAVLWATSLLPLAMTSLLAMCLVPLLGVMPAEQAYGYFGSKVVFFILGALMLAAAMARTGLSTRVATVVVRRFGKTPRRLVAAVFLLCAAGSCVMSEHAVAAMVLPIIVDLGRALRLEGRSLLGKALAFALAWGCIIGGSLTVLGGGRGPLAIAILEEATGRASSIGFLEYSLFALPMVLILLATGAVLLYRLRPEIADTSVALQALEERIRAMGKATGRERALALVMVVTVGAWALAGHELGLDTIAIIACAALFALRVVTWREIEDGLGWGIILMYGGAIALSAAMSSTGAGAWITARLVPATFDAPEVLLLSLCVVAMVLTELMSNSAVVALLLPPTLALCQTHGIDPRAATMAIVLPTNFAFMLPIATPATALAMSTGYPTSSEIARKGFILDVFGFAAVAFLVFVYWPLIGLL